MNNTIDFTLRNGDTSLPKGQRHILAYPSPLLAPCVVTEHTDEFEISFHVDGLYSKDDLLQRPDIEKYRFLYNCGELERLTKDFSFTIAPDNLYADVNLTPKVLRRDAGRTDAQTLLAEYKALISYLLAPEYAYEDYYEGGADLYGKNKKLKPICKEETFGDVRSALLSRYRQTEERERQTKTTVSKRVLRMYRILLPLLGVISVFCIGLSIYLWVDRLPLTETLLHGHGAYLRNDFMSVQDALSGARLEQLPNESKYILARSYVMSESLNVAQKENVLATLTPQTDSLYFDYWIALGRLAFEDAIDVAQRVGDDQLLLLAYIKYEAFLETDTQTLTGSEKAEKLKDLNDKIEKLSEALNADEE